jgi:arginyl-tRNA synthetase
LWFLVRQTATFVPQPKPKKVKKGEKPPEPLGADAWTEYVLHNLDGEMADEILSVIPKENRTGNWLGKLYTEASKLLEENPDWKMEVSLVQQALESHAPGWEKLWHETRRWSLVEMTEIFHDLGVTIDRQYFESEVVEKGQRIVDELLKKKIARVSEGAVIVDLQEEKLGIFLVRKSDGTSLYATKDLALAQLKQKEYASLQRSLILVDNRQSLYFKQLFETLKQMGMKTPMEFIGYEFVTLKSGAMSSREGNVVTWQSLRDEITGYARRETQTRHEDWSEGQLQHTAWSLAMGGVKYGMLKQDSDKIYTFELERALSFDGDTGPYVQYAATRLGAILKKAGWNPNTGIEAGDLSLLMEPMEKRLVLQVAMFPEACRRAAAELRPAIVAQWCSAMAARMSDFYRDVNVIGSEFGVKQARLRLIASVRSVLGIGLDLLGIPLPDEM